MARALIVVRPPWATIRTPYQPEFVDHLKRLVDRGARRWSPAEKVWEVRDDYLDDVITLCREFFEPVTVRREAPPPPPPPPPGSSTDAHRTLHVTPDAPPEVIAAAWKALVKLHHPDTHSDDPEANRRTQLINVAYERLRGGR
jgi:DnaJ-domain-containing protein 1